MSAIHPIYRTRPDGGAAVEEVLEAGQYAILGTQNPDGTPHMAPVMYSSHDGRILMETSGGTRKARNVAARGRATVLVLDPRADGAAWVSGSGPAELIRGDAAAALGRRIRSRYLTPFGEEQVGAVFATYDDVVVAVTPERWISWDMEALNATIAEHGVSFDGADRWYRGAG